MKNNTIYVINDDAILKFKTQKNMSILFYFINPLLF